MDGEKRITKIWLWIGRLALILSAVVLWIWLVNQLDSLLNLELSGTTTLYIIYVSGSVLFGTVMFFTAAPVINSMIKLYGLVEKGLKGYSGWQIMTGLIGLVLGLGIVLILNLIFTLPLPISILLCILLGFTGMMLGARRIGEARRPLGIDGDFPASPPETAPILNILDSSALIDGRIYDVARTNFIDGEFVVPSFILNELRHIADKDDVLKRNRGKRGLDVVNAMQRESAFRTVVDDTDFPEGDADEKLLKLAAQKRGKIVTVDYNLNKIAALRNIRVLNVNELANAIKPVALPGEKMKLKLLKEGKEHGQAVGYLADGTMIVVENGFKELGNEVEVTITTALQTNAGRMIFGRI